MLDVLHQVFELFRGSVQFTQFVELATPVFWKCAAEKFRVVHTLSTVIGGESRARRVVGREDRVVDMICIQSHDERRHQTLSTYTYA